MYMNNCSMAECISLKLSCYLIKHVRLWAKGCSKDWKLENVYFLFS